MVLTEKMERRAAVIVGNIRLQGNKHEAGVRLTQRAAEKSRMVIRFLGRNGATMGEICGVLRDYNLPFAGTKDRIARILARARIRIEVARRGPPIGKKSASRQASSPRTLLGSSFPKIGLRPRR